MILDVAIIPWAWHQRHMQQKDFIKTLKRCTSADTIYRIKKQLTEWKKIFANCITDKELMPRKERIYKTYQKTPNNSIFKKWAKDLNRYFSKEDL